MNALVKSNAKTSLATMGQIDPFARAGQDMGGSNALYMKFNGTNGEYTYGQQADEIPAGTKLAVNMESFRRGWICWKDEQVVEEIMVRVADGVDPPIKGDLTDHGPYEVSEDKTEGWAEQSSVELREIEGEGRTFQMKVSSKSALRALGTLLSDYAKQYKNHPGELPIVSLDSSSFMPKVKKWGKKYAPRLPIVDWANEDELLSAAGDNPDDYADGAPSTAPSAGEIAEPLEDKKPEVVAPPTNGAPRRRSF